MRKLFIPALSAATLLAVSCANTSNKSDADSTATKDSVTVTGDVVDPSANTLTDAEASNGWQLLFNGKNLDGWHIFKGKASNTWSAENGLLHCAGSTTDKSDLRGDLATDKEFDNFEFTADWKLSPQGNSGILYLVSEDFDASYLSGPEYQLIDDNNFPEKLEDWQKTGANYAMNPPLKMAAKPIGEWNTTKIIVNKGHVEHWLNGEKVADYELWTDEWKKHKAEGKWKDAEHYGSVKKGHIVFQDHGSEIWFKNVKVKQL